VRTSTHQEVRALLRRAAEQGALAPSVHNTQPWHFVVGPDWLELRAERVRRLWVLDPTARQLVISCGAALLNVRAVLSAVGPVVVDRFPDPADPDLLARVSLPGGAPERTRLTGLTAEIGRRRTNRRPFTSRAVSDEVLLQLVAAAEEESSTLLELTADQRRRVRTLCREADLAQEQDPAYREELRAWTTTDFDRRDGVPAMAVPHVDARGSYEGVVRRFDAGGSGWLTAPDHVEPDPSWLLLVTEQDDPAAWLRAGEALERLWLEASRLGCALGPLTQVVEVPETRARLRRGLGLTGFPHVRLRVGYAPPTPATPRRKVGVVVSEVDAAP
jgi:hypothetical protein